MMDSDSTDLRDGAVFKRLMEKLFGEKPISYEQAKELAKHEDPNVRLRLAARTDVKPEILYFLAEDPLPEVRRVIANNAATPRQADLLLARDSDIAVRSELAGKIARLAPQLSADERDRAKRLAYDVLETLARDQVVRVRQIVAETLKDVADAPPEVIRGLARDVELVVSGPVLECSPVLTDEDLLDIIAGGPASGALGAIARRAGVSDRVSDAVCGTGDEDAVAVLLANPSAQIREETLDLLAERAVDIEAWHGPLATRPRLPPRAALRMARYVAENLLEVLAKREDMDGATLDAVRSEVRRRLEEAERRRSRKDDDLPCEAGVETGEGPLERAQRLAKAGKLAEPLLIRSIKAGDTAFVLAAIAVMSEVRPPVIEKIFATRSAKGVVSACWKAGLSAEVAALIQRRVAFVSPRELLLPGEKGGYPLDREEMVWQIDFFSDLAGA